MQVPRVVPPYSLTVCIISECRLGRDGWETASKTNKKKVRENPAEQQTDVFEYSKVKSKYGVTGIAIQNQRAIHAGCGSHIFGHSNKNVTSCVCANKHGLYNLPERGCVTDSFISSLFLCSLVNDKLKTHTSSWLMQSYSRCHCHMIKSFTRCAPHQTQRHVKSLLSLWIPICLCSLLQCIFSRVRKPSEERTDHRTDVPRFHPAPLFYLQLTQDRMHRALVAASALHNVWSSAHIHANKHSRMRTDISVRTHKQAEEEQQMADISFINSDLFIYMFAALSYSVLKVYSDV